MLKKLFSKFTRRKGKAYAEPNLMNAYARLPVSFVRGESANLWDAEGNHYIDALGGIAVTFLGHCHPTISQTISLQANTLLHTSNLFHISTQAKLSEKLCKLSGMDKVFFSNSGAEANEAAIKISRLFAREKNIEKPVIVCMKQSFHGRTMATLSASGNEYIQKGFEPLVSEFVHVDYNNIDALEQLNDNSNIVAVMLEPIQGEGGIIVPDKGYLKQVRELCDKNGWLMIADEIQTGVGRTGYWYAYQAEEILPDIVTSAKALGNGIPIGACLAQGKAAELITPGTHGTTYGGNPFACQVALSVLDVIDQENYLERAKELGAILKKQLQQRIGTTGKVIDIRGRGLMLGVELDQVYPNLAHRFLDAGLVVNITGGGKVIRLLPAVVTTEKQVKQIVDIIGTVIESLSSK